MGKGKGKSPSEHLLKHTDKNRSKFTDREEVGRTMFMVFGPPFVTPSSPATARHYMETPLLSFCAMSQRSVLISGVRL
jgi:hypothetical protein